MKSSVIVRRASIRLWFSGANFRTCAAICQQDFDLRGTELIGDLGRRFSRLSGPFCSSKRFRQSGSHFGRESLPISYIPGDKRTSAQTFRGLNLFIPSEAMLRRSE